MYGLIAALACAALELANAAFGSVFRIHPILIAGSEEDYDVGMARWLNHLEKLGIELTPKQRLFHRPDVAKSFGATIVDIREIINQTRINGMLIDPLYAAKSLKIVVKKAQSLMENIFGYTAAVPLVCLAFKKKFRNIYKLYILNNQTVPDTLGFIPRVIMWQDSYEKASSTEWSGRVDIGANALRFHRCVKIVDALGAGEFSDASKSIAILGFKSDEGVRRNKGKVGAYDGPDTFRRKLGGLAFHKNKTIPAHDFGNICVKDEDLEKGQKALGELSALLRAKGFLFFIIGGGHEIAWGHYQGIASSEHRDKLRIINFDAHFDLRALEKPGKEAQALPFFK